MKTNIAVFASGKGSNFLAIAQAISKKKIKKAQLVFLLSDNPNAPVIFKAKKMGIKVFLVRPDLYSSKKEFEGKINRCIKENKVKLIVLAGFMRILSKDFVRAYKNKIINIHPSLLPAFKGKSGIQDAFDYGVRITGVTVHFVDEELDNGPVILQKEIKVEKRDTLVSLEEKVHKVEHKLYPEAINLFVNNKLEIKGRRVLIKGR